MKRKAVFFSIGILTALLTLVSGCTSGTASTLEQTSTMAGHLVINITDAPAAPEIEEVWLTVGKVEVHEDGAGWREVGLVGDARFNLLLLTGGLQAKLASADLTPGNYTQIRMEVNPVEIKVKGDAVLKEAKLPSNVLKFVHPFEIVDGEDTELLFDFDALKSVNVTGNDKYLFKPVIKLATTKQPQGNLEMTTLSLPNGEVDENYSSTTLTATGGKGSYTWSLDAGSTLPTGLTLTVEGVLAGKPGAAVAPGIYTFTIKVEDSSKSPKAATKTFSIEIAVNGALQIITTSLPDGTESVPYTPTLLVANNIIGTFTWSSADLPAGISLSPAGEISGTPTVNGVVNFTVTLTDSTPSSDTQEVTIRINEATP